MVGGFNYSYSSAITYALNWITPIAPPGHAGGETVKHVAAHLPGQIQSALIDLLAGSGWRIEPNSISNLLSKVIISYDNFLTKDLYDLFPGGVEELSRISDDEVKAVIHDSGIGGPNHAKVARCMQGSTVLVSLIDPNRDNIWVASLGDCQAGMLPVLFSHSGTCAEQQLGVLGVRADHSASWDVTILSANHHAALPSEIQALRSAHPGEPEVALNDRVLGGIAITRGPSPQSTTTTADRHDQLSVTISSSWISCGVPRSS